MRMRRGCTAGIVLWVLCGFVLPVSSSTDGSAAGGSAAGGDTAAASSPVSIAGPIAQASRRDVTPAGGETWTRRQERVISGGGEPTRVRIRGNSVLVPVTIVYGGREADVHLLLDTGASTTTIHNGVADQLSIDLGRAKRVRVQVVGGDVLEARAVPLDRLTVGPHTKRDLTVVVVPHKGPAPRHDGLLGMDVLQGLEYRVDFKKALLLWE
ncbi:MAG TPA: retropepsin-like aspartic protease [Syntrophales bacterium]|nr:clan AA aspartic protease [Syntrophobacterales bacterium]HQL90595.1 retropepsin-like aspartic protease [Syntrophales bacterium]